MFIKQGHCVDDAIKSASLSALWRRIPRSRLRYHGYRIGCNWKSMPAPEMILDLFVNKQKSTINRSFPRNCCV